MGPAQGTYVFLFSVSPLKWNWKGERWEGLRGGPVSLMWWVKRASKEFRRGHSLRQSSSPVRFFPGLRLAPNKEPPNCLQPPSTIKGPTVWARGNQHIPVGGDDWHSSSNWTITDFFFFFFWSGQYLWVIFLTPTHHLVTERYDESLDCDYNPEWIRKPQKKACWKEKKNCSQWTWISLTAKMSAGTPMGTFSRGATSRTTKTGSTGGTATFLHAKVSEWRCCLYFCLCVSAVILSDLRDVSTCARTKHFLMLNCLPAKNSFYRLVHSYHHKKKMPLIAPPHLPSHPCPGLPLLKWELSITVCTVVCLFCVCVLRFLPVAL